MLSAQSVADYLEQNPGFFEQHTDLLTRLHLPHPHGGRTVSIAERQVLALRDQVRGLEQRVASLVGFGQQNDALGDKVHALACRLLGCHDATAVREAARESLRSDFDVPAVSVCTWLDEADGTGPAVSAEVREAVSALDGPRVGPDAVPGTLDWFGQADAALRSFALVPLRDAGRTVGAIALASADAERFQADQGTQHLSRIGALVACALASVAGTRV